MVKQYHRLKKSPYREVMGERNDCSVMAVALICKVTYEQAHNFMKEAGRDHGEAATVQAILDVIKGEGFTVLKIQEPRQPNGYRYTPKTVPRHFKNGRYLCTTRDHAFALIDGKVEDWAHNRRYYIKTMYRITGGRHG